MPASDNVSYFSRFFLKFVEIIAAGLATAVSGYLIAHFSEARRDRRHSASDCHSTRAGEDIAVLQHGVTRYQQRAASI